MKHPNAEEWMDYLYAEVSPTRRAELDAHLGACADCAGRVATWRQCGESLDDWPLTPGVKRRAPSSGWKWAAAAALVLGLGFGLGRWSAPSRADLERLRVAMQRDVHEQLDHARGEWAEQVLTAAAEQSQATMATTLGVFAQAQEAKREADLQAIAVVLQRVEAWRRSDQARLQNDLADVAEATENGLVQLANYVAREPARP